MPCAAYRADRGDGVDVGEDGEHPGDTALDRDLIEDIRLRETAMGEGGVDVVDHDGDGALSHRGFRVAGFAGEGIERPCGDGIRLRDVGRVGGVEVLRDGGPGGRRGGADGLLPAAGEREGEEERRGKGGCLSWLHKIPSSKRMPAWRRISSMTEETAWARAVQRAYSSRDSSGRVI